MTVPSLPVADFTFFTLLFLRFATLLALAPIYGMSIVPVRVRLGLALLLALMLYGTALPAQLLPLERGELVLWIGRELFVGGLLAFVGSLIFAAVQLAGQVVGFQMGLAMAQTVDPRTLGSSSVVAEIYHLMALLLFLALDGHHAILQLVVQSLHWAPIGQALSMPTPTVLIERTGEIFALALSTAAPVVAALLATSLALGFVARTVPQMNIFAIGFSVKLAVGCLVGALAMPYLARSFSRSWLLLQADAAALLRALGQGA